MEAIHEQPRLMTIWLDDFGLAKKAAQSIVGDVRAALTLLTSLFSGS